MDSLFLSLLMGFMVTVAVGLIWGWCQWVLPRLFDILVTPGTWLWLFLWAMGSAIMLGTAGLLLYDVFLLVFLALVI